MIARRTLIAVTAVIVASTSGLAACGGSDGSSASPSSAPVATGASTSVAAEPPTSVTSETSETGDSAPTSAAPTTAAPDTVAPTDAPTTVAPTTAPPTTAAPDALQQLPGVEAVTVTVSGADPSRPTFTWTAPANAVDYQLVVQDASGTPLWAWTGTGTSIVLGGAERAPEVEGPALTGPGQVRVFAFGADGAVVGSSGWTPLAV